MKALATGGRMLGGAVFCALAVIALLGLLDALGV